MDAITSTPPPRNEPVRDYAPGSPERASLQAALAELGGQHHELTVTIDGRRHMPGGPRIDVVAPHDHGHVLGTYANAGHEDAKAAVEAALRAAPVWRAMPFDERAAVVLRAADLLSGPWRDRLNAATMLGQSKTAIQAEIDSACELADFWRFNVHFARQIHAEPAEQRRGRVEPHGLPPARGFRLRDHAVQLHRDRRQPAHRARAHGQHGDLEALPHPGPRGAHDDAPARGGGAAARCDQPAHRRRPGDLRGAARRPRARRHPFHRLVGHLPAPVAAGRREHRFLRHLPARWSGRRAARTSWSPTPRPTSTCCAPRSSAVPSSTRGRSARPPRARSSPGRSGPACATTSSTRWRRSRWATSPTSATSSAR